MSWPTTRRHPRTLTEAFDDAERASWREGWQRQHALLVADAALAVVIGIGLAAALIQWWAS